MAVQISRLRSAPHARAVDRPGRAEVEPRHRAVSFRSTLRALDAGTLGGAARASTPRPAPLPPSAHEPADGSAGRTADRAPRLDRPGDEGADGRDEPSLDPSARHAAQLAPPAAFAPAPVDVLPPVAANAVVPLETLFPALVKRIAWSGDAKRGTMRLELDDAGALGGAVIVIHADGDGVRVQMSSPRGVDAEWKERIASRLASRGLRVESVEIG